MLCFHGETDIRTFQGISVGYLAPLWPYPVSLLLKLDNDPPVEVDLRDGESNMDYESPSRQSDIRQYWHNLANVEHKLVVSKARDRDDQYVVVDAFMYVHNPSDVIDRCLVHPWVHSYTACVKQKDLLETNDKIALGLGLGLGVPTFIVALWQMARWYSGRDAHSKKGPDAEAG